MEQVVERGTATRAKIPGFTVAGKTGTADKLVNGRYSNTLQNVSIVGFVPSRDPALAVIVMIDYAARRRRHRRRGRGADLPADRGRRPAPPGRRARP